MKICAISLCLIAALMFVGCGKNQADPVIILVDHEEYAFSDETTLYDYMLMLKDDGKIDFTCSEGAYGAFITSVNGVENGIAGNPCWMIYTDDPEYVDNSEWGTEIQADGKTFRSATAGISGIKITDGCRYVLFLTAF